MMKISYLSLLAMLIVTMTQAQDIAFELVGPLPPVPYANFEGISFGSVVFAADVDNDNDQDVLITGYRSKLYTNDGSGNFSEVLGTPFEGIFRASVAFADVDNDNDQDVLITGDNGAEEIAKLYTNDGNGNFSEVLGTPFEGVRSSSVAFTDVDNDNDHDVLITGFGSEAIAKLYTNDGSGNFSEVLATPFEGVSQSSVAFADVDNDSDQDVLIIGSNGSFSPVTKLYTNDGGGNFSESPASFEGFYRSSVAFADIDNDNDQDVLITGDNNSFSPITKLYTNDGSGNFSEVLESTFDGVQFGSVAFIDVDNDNDQDVLITGDNGSNFVTKLYTNDGIGNFSEVLGTPFEGVRFGSVAFTDVDNDNDQDVFITGQNSIRISNAFLYVNDGSGNFLKVRQTPFDGSFEGSVAFADIESDGDQDVLVIGDNGSEAIAKLYTNDGSGNFKEVLGTPFEGVRSSSVAFADVDNDNDQDVLIAGTNGLDPFTKLYTNDGSGNFSEMTGTPFEAATDGSITFADIDNDNDQDVLITGDSGFFWFPFAKLYTNDGSGNYSESPAPFDGVYQSSVAFADIDSDNDQDVLIVGTNGVEPVAKLYVNDGSGNFSEATGAPFVGTRESSVAFADIDNDNDQDVLIAGTNGLDPVTKLYVNDGSGNFSEVPVPFEAVWKGSVSFADIEGDGDQDVLVVGTSFETRITGERIKKLYINDGSGNFSEVLGTLFPEVDAESVALADIDNDNDQDVLFTGIVTKLYRNISEMTVGADDGHFSSNLLIFPNPSKGHVNIEFGTLRGAASIKVFSVIGQLIYQKENIRIPRHQFELDVLSGIYFIEIQVQGKKQQYKLVIKKD